MHKPQQQVREFSIKFGKSAPETFTPLDGDLALCLNLIGEEYSELLEASGCIPDVVADEERECYMVRAVVSRMGPHGPSQRHVEQVDGLCDLLYVVYFMAVKMGVDLEPFFDEVQRANMAKEGGGESAAGKIQKPPGWTPPDIAGLLEKLHGVAR